MKQHNTSNISLYFHSLKKYIYMKHMPIYYYFKNALQYTYTAYMYCPHDLHLFA